MFGSILGRKKETISEEDTTHNMIVEKVSKMNLTDMRSYIRNSVKDFEICGDGLNEVMLKLITKDANSSKYYINSDDMDSKKKKAFDLVLLIAGSKKITVTTVEYIQKFVEIYQDIITRFDTDFKEIYASRFNDALSVSVENVNEIAELQRKMNILGE